MQEVGGIDLSTYQAVHSCSYYGDVGVSESGSVRPTEPLSEEVISFLVSIDVDTSLWNGFKGVLGRPYVSPHTQQHRGELTIQQGVELRAKYIDVKKSLYLAKSKTEFKREMEMKVKLQGQLESSAKEMEVKVEKVRKRLYSLGCGKSTEREKYSRESLVRLLEKLEGEVSSTKKAADTIGKKILELRVDIAECENGFLRRFAILRSLFEEEKVAKGLISRFYKDGREDIKTVNGLFQQSCEGWIKTLRAKRFYVDAKIGLGHVYKVERHVKGILENLQDAMNSQKGLAVGSQSEGGSSALALPSEVSVDFRLGYVRQLWGQVNGYLKKGLPYIKRTSLKHGLAEGAGAGAGSLKDGDLLPRFSKFEMKKMRSRSGRICALHKTAAVAYKVVNRVFDTQEKWIRKAKVELERRENEEMKANERLIQCWEKLLAIPFENEIQEGTSSELLEHK